MHGRFSVSWNRISRWRGLLGLARRKDRIGRISIWPRIALSGRGSMRPSYRRRVALLRVSCEFLPLPQETAGGLWRGAAVPSGCGLVGRGGLAVDPPTHASERGGAGVRRGARCLAPSRRTRTRLARRACGAEGAGAAAIEQRGLPSCSWPDARGGSAACPPLPDRTHADGRGAGALTPRSGRLRLVPHDVPDHL